MSNERLSSELMQAHVDVQMGTYFSDVQDLGDGIRFASSARISDYYWNYAFGLTCSPQELPDRLASVNKQAQQIGRRPAIYVTPDTRPARLSEILAVKDVSAEVWMTLSRAALKAVGVPADLRISLINPGEDMEQFIRVFRDAYGSGSPDSPGYSGLPEEYPESIRDAEPVSAKVFHFLGWEGNEPAAISSVFCKPPYAGLYNVGTTHAARRKKYGSVMSSIAITHAFEQGNDTIFLQTEADSPVEELYRKLGFERAFVGEFLVLD